MDSLEKLDLLDAIMMNLDRYKTRDTFQAAVFHAGNLMQDLNLLNRDSVTNVQAIINAYDAYLSDRVNRVINTHSDAQDVNGKH